MTDDMERATVYFERQQLEELKILAIRKRTSMSDLVREAVDQVYFNTPEEGTRMTRIIENLLRRHDYCEARYDNYTYGASRQAEGYQLTVAKGDLPAHSREMFDNLADLVAQLPTGLTWVPGEYCSCDVCDMLDAHPGSAAWQVRVREADADALREAIDEATDFRPGDSDWQDPTHQPDRGWRAYGEAFEIATEVVREITEELDRRGVYYDLDCDEEEDEMYEIVTPLTASPGSEWTTDGLGASDANEFDSVEEAQEGIEALRGLDEDWATMTLAVRRVGDDWPLRDTIEN